MLTKKRKPFQIQVKHRTLTGGERERSKANISWLLALSRNDMEAIMAGLSRHSVRTHATLAMLKQIKERSTDDK